MKDPAVLIDRLDDLASLAREAKTVAECAAVYAAARAIASEFNAKKEQFDGYLLEKVERARWHLCAAVGYEETNGHSKSQHVVWAMGEINTLHDLVDKASDSF